MAKKRLSLADRIAQKNIENTPDEEIQKEKNIISLLSSPDTEPENDINKSISDNNRVRSRSGQGQLDTISTQGQPNGDTVSTQDRVRVKSLSGQGQVSSIRSSINPGSGQGQVDTNNLVSNNIKTEYFLAKQQQKIYTWFLNNGVTGYFNKGLIQRDTGINHPTIRKSITKLKALNIIKFSEYDPVSRQQPYIVNLKIKVKLITGSGQGQVSNIRSGSGQGQVDIQNTSYKLVSKYLNKLTNFIENSPLWKSQGLGVKKCEEWINEFYPDHPEDLLTQLIFAEETAVIQNPKHKTPADVFYGCLLKGGLTRPKNFEFPEERAARIRKEEFEKQKKIFIEQEDIRKQEKELADKLAFNELLKDNESIESLVCKIEEGFVTPKAKISIKLYRKKGQIDSRLEKALEREFNKNGNE